ncbi:MAG: hypothetical protein ACRD9R_20295 [Pyrinomonadaceae bacterium]
MKTLLLIATLSLQSGSGSQPCAVAQSQSREMQGRFSPKEICRVEQKVPLLRVGMSQEEALKTLGLWKQRKKLWAGVIAHGGRVMHSLGSGYVLEFYWSEYITGTLKRATLYHHSEGKEQIIARAGE